MPRQENYSCSVFKVFLTLEHHLPQCKKDAGELCSDTTGRCSVLLGIRNALKKRCFWELYLPGSMATYASCAVHTLAKDAGSSLHV